MSEHDEAAKKKAEMMAAATPADPDTEERLLRFHKVVISRRKDPVAEAEYEAERDALAAQLKKEGPRYFIDDFGAKRYAYAVNPEGVEVDVAAIIALHDAGEIDDELFERLAPRAIDKDQLRTAIARGANPRARKPGITPAQVARIARIVPRTSYVGFSEDQEEPG